MLPQIEQPRILDIGCGPADIIASLPDSIGEYMGIDMNAEYIENAKQRWRDRNEFIFYCQKIEEATLSQKNYYDIVLAIAIIHHLNDREALRLFDMAYQSLASDGLLVTYDNVISTTTGKVVV